MTPPGQNSLSHKRACNSKGVTGKERIEGVARDDSREVERDQ